MAVSTLTSVTSAIQTVTNVLLVSPQATVGYQPQGSPPLALPPPILFHYEGEQTAELRSSITDHYSEANVAIQNSIALPPPKITTQGFVGELNDVPPNAAFEILYQAANKLVTLAGYTPTLSTTALIAYNEAVFAYQTAANLVNSAVSTFSAITGVGGESVISGSGFLTVQPNQTKQQQYFQQFYGYWATRTLFTIQTPWAIFEDMAIELVRPVQSAETNVITDFEVTFKQIRYTTTGGNGGAFGNSAGFAGRLAQQAASVVSLGTSSLTPSSTTLNSVLGL